MASLASNAARVCWLGSAWIAFASCGTALASPVVAKDVSEKLLRIQAHNDTGGGTVNVDLADAQWDPNARTLSWSMPGPVDIIDHGSGAVVATLLNASVFIRWTQDCEIDVNTGVAAGSSETTFVVRSTLVSIKPVPAWTSRARATASFTVTHLAGPYAYLQGLGPPGTGAFRTYYNGYLDEGTRFSHLLASVYVDGGGTATGSQAYPTTGYQPIGEDVSDLSTEIAFTLTANDLAYATTTTGMPEPEECFGDITGDGIVDIDDIGALLAAYGTQTGDANFNPDADFDGDGYVDIGDLGDLLPVFGQSCW